MGDREDVRTSEQGLSRPSTCTPQMWRELRRTASTRLSSRPQRSWRGISSRSSRPRRSAHRLRGSTVWCAPRRVDVDEATWLGLVSSDFHRVGEGVALVREAA
jgi:hypothetical protein